MKKLLLPLLFCFQLISAQSPITFNISELPVAGTTQRIAVDTVPLPTINFGSKGANQFYDFSNLSLYKYDTVEFRTPTTGANSQQATCPNADVAITTDGINFLLTNTDNANNKLTLEGFQGQLTPGNTITAAYSTKPDLYVFPTNYQTNFSGNGYLQKQVPGSQVGQPFVTTVELTITTQYTDTIDGWGRVKTPLGTYKCLRKQRKETTRTQIRALVFGQWNNVSDDTKTTVRYQYVTKEAKGTVVNFNYDTANVLQSVTWSMVPPTAPIANFGSVVGSGGLVTFADSSDFYPTSWSWTFGDGGTSTQQNPTHTYTANGTYTVCLTATNAGGSSTQVCKQVVITGLASAPVANFTSANGSNGLVTFTDQSTNTPTSWAWTFGDGGTSTQQNPTHTYTANGTYTVCLTATNGVGSSTQVCKQVTITNVVVAPVADFSFVNVSGGLVSFTDLSTNTPTSWAWTFGDAGTSTQQNPSHLYTSNNTYNVCLTATNTGGSNQRCKNVVVSGISATNSAPVAFDDTASVLQPNGLVRNVGSNDIDPNGDNLCVTLVYGSPNFADAGIGNCTSIRYTPDSAFVGTDSCYYIICDNGNPILCDTGKFVVTSLFNAGVYPVAVDDVASALQPDGATVNVTTNDNGPSGPFCVTAIYGGGSAFAISGCNNIVYTPDSLFTGNDTVWYVICDNGQPTWCDTASLVVTSSSNPALLPVANFTWLPELCNGVVFTNTSTGFTSATITIHQIVNAFDPDSTYNISSTLHYYSSTPTHPGLNVQACLTATNQFGSATKCDTAQFICSGINEVTLSGIQLYPNPTNAFVTVDMSRNQDEATRNYAAIEIYNAIGEKVKVVTEKNTRLLNISVAELTDGMYLATLVDAKGARKTLGRFVVNK